MRASLPLFPVQVAQERLLRHLTRQPGGLGIPSISAVNCCKLLTAIDLSVAQPSSQEPEGIARQYSGKTGEGGTVCVSSYASRLTAVYSVVRTSWRQHCETTAEDSVEQWFGQCKARKANASINFFILWRLILYSSLFLFVPSIAVLQVQNILH